MLGVVQGDVFEFEIKVRGVEPDLISEVTFQCDELNIKQIAEREEEVYRVRIEGAITRDFKPGPHFFTVSLILIDGEKFTPVPKGLLEVIRKKEGLYNG